MVTGAGRGIGAECAWQAARAGYSVCVNYRSDARSADRVVERIGAAGGKAVAIAADVAREDEVTNLFARCDRELGRVTDLINNAGIVAPPRRVDQFDGARLRRVFETNVLGAFFCARETVRRTSTRHGGDGGVIVNISSVAAVLGSPNEYVDYAASKGAIDTMTRGLAKEVAAEGIRVVAIRPGLIETGIHEPGRLERLAPSVPMLRAGTPAEVAQVAVFLLGAQASYITGAVIDVGGGR
jgi:NAD(P)-dependent dehydrogenase (short-subunit alcohol dehydrogenase family)